MAKSKLLKRFPSLNFVLPATLLVVPEGIIKQIETLLYRFLWGTRDKVKRVNVLQNVKHGELNMVDVKIFLNPSKLGGLKD